MNPLLTVSNLTVRLPGPNEPVTIVDRVSYTVLPRRVFGIAGESGSGKTMSVLALVGLAPADAVISGTATYADNDLLHLPEGRLRDIRGREVAVIFQDPMTSLHPMMTIERQLTEHVRHHLKLSHRDARDRAIELLEQVRIPDPKSALHAYPHQFSGGMRQRIAIAIALMCQPRLLIADEPTTALDVTVQAGLLRLLERLRERFDLSVILISHDLGVMSAIADDLTIFYAGRIVESGPTSEVLRRPRHPYTAALIASLPHPEAVDGERLVSIVGSSPSPLRRPSGCAFHPRCKYVEATCSVEVPNLISLGDQQRHMLACPVDPLFANRA